LCSFIGVQVSKKRKFVADGIFYAELNEFLTRELSEDNYSGVEVRVTPARTEIIIQATRTKNVLGDKANRIRELSAVVQKRFGFPEVLSSLPVLAVFISNSYFFRAASSCTLAVSRTVLSAPSLKLSLSATSS
jgi:hypothetical protein